MLPTAMRRKPSATACLSWGSPVARAISSASAANFVATIAASSG
jgi:hypothetical protein